MYINNSRTSLGINESTPNTTHTHTHNTTTTTTNKQKNKKNNNTIMTGFGMKIMLILTKF